MASRLGFWVKAFIHQPKLPAAQMVVPPPPFSPATSSTFLTFF